MPKITFFPLGNADCCLVDLANGEKLIFDFGNEGNPADEHDLRIDLAQAIRDDLAAAERDHVEALAFTHLDRDHYSGASEVFWLEHDSDYQDDDRIRINEMWVPAAVIIDDDCDVEEGKVLQAEARHRLIEGIGIRVFSRPDLLKDWLAKHKISIEDRADCIIDAGTVVPSFNLTDHGVEFFVHSPFGHRLNETEVVERNKDAIMVQATFDVDGQVTKVILGSDVPWDHLQEIVEITKAHGREERLEWDVFKLPHHCSYLSLAAEKGKEKTEPVKEVAWLFEKASSKGGYVISPSKPIPSGDDDDQPPHRQAANYYKGLAGIEFRVTMEHPSVTDPRPIVITIDKTKARLEQAQLGSAYVVTHTSPRAG